MPSDVDRSYRISESLRSLIVPIGTLRADPMNARLHPERNLSAIRASLERFGQQKPVVASADGTVLAGNGMLSAAESLGWTHLAAVRTGLGGDEARAYAVADNRTNELSYFDDGALAALFSEIPTDLAVATGFTVEEIAKLLHPVPRVPSAPGLTVRFDAAQAEIVERAVSRVRTADGDMPTEEAIMIVCRAYLARRGRAG